MSTENINRSVAADVDSDDSIEVLARLAWTAYVGPVLSWTFLLGIGVPLGVAIHPGFGAALGCAGLTMAGYRLAWMRSVTIFCDVDGVWVHRGVLPWNRGAFGVKWRDLDEATFVPGFASWALRSHTVVLRHRFTRDAKIALDHVANGDKVAAFVNARHRAL